MRDRMDDHLIQEPRIRRVVRRPAEDVAEPPRDGPPAAGRPRRDERAGDRSGDRQTG
ncbi:hypothetical protein GCM10023200_41160 [Actinomycetospora chlora]|uniref:Uncharacterized protein n=1 Tax=Actinomycetospora chlora TaxID=663608 RepID=A0ABP9BSX5_9PSEU